MSSDSTTSNKLGDPAWANARFLSKYLGPLPIVIPRTTRTIWSSGEGSKATVSPPTPAAIEAIKPIEKSTKLKSGLYAAAQSLFPDRFAPHADRKDQAQVALEVLGSTLFTAVLTSFYLYRRFKKICSGQDWDFLSKEFLIHLEFGYHLGTASSSLGPAEGLLVGGVRFPALACMMLKKTKEFSKYRKSYKKKFDFVLERETWGCEHTQIAAFMLSDMGLAKNSLEVALALSGQDSKTSPLSPAMAVWSSAIKFIDNLRAGTKLSVDMPELKSLEIASDSVLSDLKKKFDNLVDSGPTFTWLAKGGKDEEEKEGAETAEGAEA